ncbi:hypothetical protein ACSHWB_29855 [Lentzea sp. HUAS TT2]|uniref:hypothetical protein n=1 Tax=Lentzea sp. HUAS TT2 TaxID=3447454 RepID=UPI003F71627A
MAIGRVLVAVACALMLTAQSTAAAPSQDDYRPAIMTMRYDAGELTGVVHAPRTLVGVRPVVFNVLGSDAYAQDLARRGIVVVQVGDPSALEQHRELWRDLRVGKGPLALRFGGFTGHLAVAEP